jgi:hypothetical protein
MTPTQGRRKNTVLAWLRFVAAVEAQTEPGILSKDRRTQSELYVVLDRWARAGREEQDKGWPLTLAWLLPRLEQWEDRAVQQAAIEAQNILDKQ